MPMEIAALTGGAMVTWSTLSTTSHKVMKSLGGTWQPTSAGYDARTSGYNDWPQTDQWEHNNSLQDYKAWDGHNQWEESSSWQHHQPSYDQHDGYQDHYSQEDANQECGNGTWEPQAWSDDMQLQSRPEHQGEANEAIQVSDEEQQQLASSSEYKPCFWGFQGEVTLEPHEKVKSGWMNRCVLLIALYKQGRMDYFKKKIEEFAEEPEARMPVMLLMSSIQKWGDHGPWKSGFKW